MYKTTMLVPVVISRVHIYPLCFTVLHIIITLLLRLASKQLSTTTSIAGPFVLAIYSNPLVQRNRRNRNSLIDQRAS